MPREGVRERGGEEKKQKKREMDEMGREKRRVEGERERKGTVSQRAGTATNHRQFHRGAMQTGDHWRNHTTEAPLALLSRRSYQNDLLFCNAKEGEE